MALQRSAWLVALPLVAALLTPLAARAQVATDSWTQRPLKPVVTFGLTYGGDNLRDVPFTNGTTKQIRSGGLYTFGGGLAWTPPSLPFLLQGTLNYHADSVSASNGSVSFRRYPLELLGIYTLADWRFGLGGRYVLAPELRSDVGTPGSIKYKNAFGVVGQVGYGLTPSVSLNLRVVSESYEEESSDGVPTSKKSSGNHVGVNVVLLI